jgi:hypothetical protein
MYIPVLLLVTVSKVTRKLTIEVDMDQLSKNLMRKGRLSKGGGILTVQRIEIILATTLKNRVQRG